MAEESPSNERHEVMTYSKVINDATLAADEMSGIGQQGHRITYGCYKVIRYGTVVASILKTQLKKVAKTFQLFSLQSVTCLGLEPGKICNFSCIEIISPPGDYLKIRSRFW